MSVIADFTVPTEAFVLAETLEQVPAITIRVERVVAHGEETVTPYFRATGGDLDRLGSVLSADPTIEDVIVLEVIDGERLYRATWVGNVRSLTYALDAGETAVLEAEGTDDGWELRFPFPDHDKLSAFDAFCRGRDLPFDLLRTFKPANPGTYGPYEVTDEQRDAIVLAFERGYFEVPREVSSEDLAAELGVSAQAVSAPSGAVSPASSGTPSSRRSDGSGRVSPGDDRIRSGCGCESIPSP